MRIKSKTFLWSVIIAIATVGFIALFDIILPSKRVDITEHGWGFYIVLLIVIFVILLFNLCRIDVEKEEKVNHKSQFIYNTVFSVIFLILATQHFLAHDSVRDWVLAIIFTAALPKEVRSAVQSYRSWKGSNQSDEK